jgi:hypothetical protein
MYETGSPHVARNKRFELTPFRHTWVVEYAMPLCGGQFDLKTTVYKIEFGGEGSMIRVDGRWSQLDRDEWVRRTWPARRLTERNGSGSQESVGELILTNQRLLFAGPTGAELAAVNLDELTAVVCKRHGLLRNTLMVETSSGERFVFRTERMACKQIEARSGCDR